MWGQNRQEREGPQRISISFQVSYGVCDALKAGCENQEVFARSFGGWSQGQEAISDVRAFLLFQDHEALMRLRPNEAVPSMAMLLEKLVTLS